MKRIFTIGIVFLASIGLASCADDARVVSRNLSKAADNFEVMRRIVFFNGITDKYLLVIEGRCSMDTSRLGKGALTVTCKTGMNEYKKHYLGLSDNVSYFAEQVSGSNVSAYHYRITFKPQAVLPDMDVRVDGGEIVKNRH